MSLSHHPNIVRNGLVAYFDAANPKSYPAGQDPYVSGVNLLFDGESLVDKSAKTQSFTNNSSVTVSTTQKKFGNSSLYFSGRTADGGSNSYLSFAANSDFGFGSGDWTVETWFYKTTPLASLDVLFDNRVGAGTNVSGVALYVQAGVVKTGNNAERLAGATIATGVWNHLMISRSGNNIYLGVNGTVVSAAFSTTLHSAPQLYIGNSVVSEYAGGYMDDYRVTKGFARYTANYTVPAATFSLPGRITDLTTNKGVGSFIGSGISYSSTNAGIVTLDGSNGYGVLPNTLTIGPTSTFTLCAWVNYISRPTGGVARRSVLDQSVNTNDFEPILGFPYTYSASKMGLEVGKAGVASQIAYSANTNNLDQWYYLTGLFKNGSADFYINGVYQSSVTYSATVNSATANSKNWGIGGVFFNGTIVGPYANCKVGPIQVYNRNLASGEIFQNYNATKSRYGY